MHFEINTWVRSSTRLDVFGTTETTKFQNALLQRPTSFSAGGRCFDPLACVVGGLK